MKRAFLLIVIVICLLSFPSISSCLEDYDTLYDEYINLSAENDNLKIILSDYRDTLGIINESVSTLYCYFEGEDFVSFDDAYEAFTVIHEELSKYYH